MIKLITLENDLPVFNPEVRMFAPFRKLLERDKGAKAGKEYYDKGDSDGRRKSISTKELAFIYWYADPRSSYVESYANDLELREQRVKRLVDLPEKWKIDSAVQEAIDFYLEEIKDDFDVKYLEDNISSAAKTGEYLRNVDYSLRDTKGKPVYDPLQIAKINKESGGVLESLKLLREKAFKKVVMNTKIRGGGNVGLFEE